MTPGRARTIGLAALALASGCGPRPVRPAAHAAQPSLAAAAPEPPELADGLPSGTIARLEIDLVALRASPFASDAAARLTRLASELGWDGAPELVEVGLAASRRLSLLAVAERDGTIAWVALLRGDYGGELARRLSTVTDPRDASEGPAERGLLSTVLGEHTFLVGRRGPVEESARRLTGRLPPMAPRDATVAAFDLVTGGTTLLAFAVDPSAWERATSGGGLPPTDAPVGPLAVGGSLELGATLTATLGIVGPDALAAAEAAEGLRESWLSLCSSTELSGLAAALRDGTVESRPRGAVLVLRLDLAAAHEALSAAAPLLAGMTEQAFASAEDDEPGLPAGPLPPASRPGPTAASTALVDSLAALGFFEPAGSAAAVHDAEKWARETGWPFDASSGRVFEADPEELVDGGLEPLLSALRPFLARAGARHEVAEAPPTDDLALVVDGRRVLLATDRELDDPCWSELLALRVARLVDGWLDAVGSKERAYFLEPDGARPRLVLLTPEMMARIRRHPDYDPETWPMRLTDDPVPGCEDAYARMRSP
ncbi:MAG: hypothetical protein U0230_25830 [Polyangiales bacterium]